MVREKSILCVISGLRREVDENCPLLGCHAATSVIPYRRFGTTYRYHLQGLRILGPWRWER